jgi:hypothetical protein
MSAHVSTAKTSIDILGERNALRARVEQLEEAMRAVVRETEYAIQLPEVSLLTLCRIRTLVRHAQCLRALG